MAVLVKRLQESLTRMETFDVVTTSPGSMEGKTWLRIQVTYADHRSRRKAHFHGSH